ncbi:MAG: phospholipid/cholesterol/gamma-HCH transport system substrate-binding protein [Frankiales bacterium]|jgi:phospholipid/cholesterol/gamma-HCH transport system substrate-binding protein|nr:phospholipid/cholesterol/gamma-HCH transport system substrate-binding protein [Frankiales bacterium]
MMRPRLRLAASVLGTLVVLSGCSFNGVYSLPLPGAVANRGATYTVTVEFRDALDLVPYSAVKVNDAIVGHVHAVRWKIGPDGPFAEVDCRLKQSVKLPRNASATIAETSLLGEKYVALAAPSTVKATGLLANNDRVGLESTDRAATVEEVLSSLSLLLNGGGLAQVKVIAAELNNAFSGREPAIRDSLERLRTVVTGLNGQRSEIVRALENVNKLASTLRQQEGVITTALETMPPALGVLNGQREQLTTMLEAVDKLGRTAGSVIRASRDDLLANLKALEPTLTKLAEAGKYIPPALDMFLNYPFATGSDKVFHGDYGNVFLTIDLYGPQLLHNFQTLNTPAPKANAPAAPSPSKPKARPLPTPVPLPQLPGPLNDGQTTIDRLLLGVLR